MRRLILALAWVAALPSGDYLRRAALLWDVTK